MLILHVLSLEQQRAMLARLAACARPGATLLGLCAGSEGIASEWVPTPDGSGRRFLHNADTLTAELIAAGWSEDVEVIIAPSSTMGAAVCLPNVQPYPLPDGAISARLMFFAKRPVV